jgi:predicted DNA-binding transcriptional regulator YafY
MLLLQIHQRMTAGQLAKRLEVSERTILRDMDALSGAGIPVFAERGIGGGWSMLEGYRTNLTGLTRDEIQALFLTKPSRLLADLGLEKASDAALLKLHAALPSASRDTAEYSRQRIHIDISGWNRSEESIQFLPIVQEAVWRDRKLQLTYQRGGGCDAVERLVDPLGLVAKGSIWYLVAGVDGEIRTYRVSRLENAEVTDLPCVRPEGFDLAAYWERSSATFKDNFPRYDATVRCAPEILPRLRYAGRFARVEHIDQADANGWARVSIRFQFEEEACEYALGFGPQLEVIEPASLRERVMRTAESTIAFYAAASTQ